MAETTSQAILIDVADGTKMGAFIAGPSAAGAYPGVIVFQELFGVNHHVRAVTERLAAAGFVALAPELYHRTAPGFEGSYHDFQPSWEQRSQMTDEGLAHDIQAAHDWLQGGQQVDSKRIAAVGFCMGGTVAFAANTLVPLRAAVSYYGGGIAPKLLPQVKDAHAPILMFWGGLDKHIPPEQRRAVADALQEAGKPFVQVVFSDADHGFNCDERASYNASAARQAWVLMQEFLKVHLG